MQPSTSDDDIARVVMLWPADLKREIQREVGKRGLTAYVLDAVRQKRSLDQDHRPQVHPQPVDVAETPVQKCARCGTDLDDGACWVCGS